MLGDGYLAIPVGVHHRKLLVPRAVLIATSHCQRGDQRAGQYGDASENALRSSAHGVLLARTN